MSQVSCNSPRSGDAVNPLLRAAGLAIMGLVLWGVLWAAAQPDDVVLTFINWLRR